MVQKAAPNVSGHDWYGNNAMQEGCWRLANASCTQQESYTTRRRDQSRKRTRSEPLAEEEVYKHPGCPIQDLCSLEQDSS
jgi:hypothetical protein